MKQSRRHRVAALKTLCNSNYSHHGAADDAHHIVAQRKSTCPFQMQAVAFGARNLVTAATI
jgi:hypothetical protein